MNNIGQLPLLQEGQCRKFKTSVNYKSDDYNKFYVKFNIYYVFN